MKLLKKIFLGIAVGSLWAIAFSIIFLLFQKLGIIESNLYREFFVLIWFISTIFGVVAALRRF